MERRPNNSELNSAAPLAMWREAEAQARRSNLKRFRTGAVVFDKSGRILSRGCSHHGTGRYGRPWMHAEAHALGSMWPVLDRLDASAVIVTLTKADNFAVSSRPCAFCANLLQKHNIKRVHYAELCNDDTWAVATHDVSALHSAAGEITMYAKNMRIV